LIWGISLGKEAAKEISVAKPDKLKVIIKNNDINLFNNITFYYYNELVHKDTILTCKGKQRKK
jgi:hypothetical protein